MEQTHFGFETVATAEKSGRVRAVFDSVAPKYDIMNDLMSGGLHRLWKHFTLARTGLRPSDRALDVAGGTGDLSAGMAKQVGRRASFCTPTSIARCSKSAVAGSSTAVSSATRIHCRPTPSACRFAMRVFTA
jgi:hypothetical protein